jgi:transcriptional regulator GlxA family with amidase domain
VGSSKSESWLGNRQFEACGEIHGTKQQADDTSTSGKCSGAGGQSRYGPLLAAQAESPGEAFDDLERWIAEHLKEDLGVEALARRVGMSPRNFARVYTAKRNRTPAQAVEAIRIDAARRLLEETSARISDIAEQCGFNNEEQMRWAFARNLGISPREYRQRFPPAHESRAST